MRAQSTAFAAQNGQLVFGELMEAQNMRAHLWVVTERQDLAEVGDRVLAQLLWVANVAVQNGLEGLVALPRLDLVLNLLCSDDYLTPV